MCDYFIDYSWHLEDSQDIWQFNELIMIILLNWFLISAYWENDIFPYQIDIAMSLYYTLCISLSFYFSLYILFVHILVDNCIPLGVHFSLIPYPYRLRQWLISRKPVWRSYSKGKTWPTQAWPLPATALGLGQR